MVKPKGDNRKQSPAKLKSDKNVVRQIFNAESPLPLLLVTSPDRVRRDRFALSYWERFFAEAPADDTKKRNESRSLRRGPTLERIQAADLNNEVLARLLEDLRSLSLFARKRLFLVEQVSSLSQSAAESLAKILVNARTEAAILLTGEALKADSPIIKAVPTECRFEIEELKGHELTRWVEKELRREGFAKFDDNVIRRLIDVGEGEPDSIIALIEKLALFCDGDSLTLRDISQISEYQAASFGEFELIELITQGKSAKAEGSIEQILHKSPSPLVLNAMMSKSFSNYLVANYMLSRGDGPQKVAERLKLNPWVTNKVITGARRYGTSRLVNALANLLRADSKLKGKSLGNVAVFSELLWEIQP